MALNVCRKCGNMFELSMSNCPKCKTSAAWKSKPNKAKSKCYLSYNFDGTPKVAKQESYATGNNYNHGSNSCSTEQVSLKEVFGCFGAILCLVAFVLSITMPHVGIPFAAILYVIGKNIYYGSGGK